MGRPREWAALPYTLAGRSGGSAAPILWKGAAMAQIQFQFDKKDEYFTPAYAVCPIIPYLRPGAAVWCPFDTQDSAYVRVFSANGFRVIYGHIQTGEDFFQADVPECDYIISNPPYSLRTQVMERLYAIGRPFAMLINFQGIFGSQKRFQLFKTHRVEMIWLSPRVEYMTGQGELLQGVPFQSGYLCSGICPNQLEFVYIDKNRSEKE